MEAAIAWLVRTILATLLMDKLDAWIRQVGLAEDIGNLKSEIRRVKMVVSAMKERGIKNEPVSESLALLQDHLYEADDVIDELDYYRLQQQVQAAEKDHTSSSRGVKKRKRRSKAWDNFVVITEDQEANPLTAACKHCRTLVKCAAKDGTSGMRNHSTVCPKKPGANDQPPNPSSARDANENATPTASSRKRRRAHEASAQITAAITYTPWEKAELSNRIQKITSQLKDVCGEVSGVLRLHGSDSASSSNHHPSIASGRRLRTSSLVPRQVYGRVAEKDSIRKLILEEKSDGVRILPIVGIAGVGKTALAQFVYNNPEVESKFDHRIWVWVSHDVDEVRLTREMLGFVSLEKHEGISSFARLQDILKGHANSKRLLLIFDDVWDDMKDWRWDKLLAPLVSGQSNGIVILVTTRNLSVAKRLGTLKPVRLSALGNDDFWLLFKSHAFGDGDYEGPRNLSTIGRKIAEKLKGNPLAAVSIGALLREDLTVDHWSNILEKENWKSLELGEGIMPSLKLSYDQLSYRLQKCFSNCSIFPNKHMFFGKDLVYIWISQGYVKSTCLTQRLEETGWEYLTDLVNLGFFQQVEQEEELSPYSQIWYSACGLMHDFARIVSRTECATIDGLQCIEMLPTIQHLSIVTDSAYNSNDRQGNIPRNVKFEEKLRNTVRSASKLRTLVLHGHYDSFFFQLFQDIFQKSGNLRVVQMSAAPTDFNSFLCLANPAHLRYLKHESNNGFSLALPQGLIKFFHLEVLDIGSNTDATLPAGVNNLLSLRHLVAHEAVFSSIASIGKMTSLQDLDDFQVQMSSGGFEITQLQSMNKLVQLGVSQLGSVKTGEEASGARLRGKVHLEKLHLSWNDTLREKEYSSDGSSESSEELLPMDDGGPSSEASVDTAREVLEGLEPHMDLQRLQISGYIGTTSPTWLASSMSVTSLQTLHLDGCGGWRILPSLESLPFLRKLKLISMQEVTEVLVPPLEELVLFKMPELVRCTSTFVENLKSSLRDLQIEQCIALKEFDLFENDDESETRQRSWLPGLQKLILSDCPHLEVLKPLPPSTTVSKLLIRRVSKLPYIEGSSSEKLSIRSLYEDAEESSDELRIPEESSDKLRILDDKILAFRNLRNLKSMTITGCLNLYSFSLEGFSHLVSLKSLEIRGCQKLFSSHVMPEHTNEDVTAANIQAFPSLQSLIIASCGITGKWLSLLLRHAPDLEELYLDGILSIEEERSWSSGEQDDALTGLAQDRLVHIPLNLKKITFWDCPRLTVNWSEEGFSGFTSLQELTIWGCARKLSSFMLKDGNDDQANLKRCSQKTLQPCFPRNLASLKKLVVGSDHGLESLKLRSCTALEELTIESCASLTALEGLQSLGSLRHLKVLDCPFLPPCLESFSIQGYELLPQLETLEINDPSFLTTSFCNHLTSLRRLNLECLELTQEQERAIVLLKSLQHLELIDCSDLFDLLPRMHALPSLKRLKIDFCRGISRLPEIGLPLSLEELEISRCTKELADHCRLLATSKLNVKISDCG